MANYYAAARSNYVRISDREGLEASIGLFGGLETTDDEFGRFAILCEEGWPGFSLEDEVEFDPVKHIMPYVCEGEVFVIMETGHEKLRYLVGFATAYCRADDEVLQWGINLSDIYSAAAREFGVSVETISPVQY